jgi:nucleotide-binding universal stress UspA family protein
MGSQKDSRCGVRTVELARHQAVSILSIRIFGRLHVKTILLHMDDDAAMEARFQAALSLARQQGGHLTCLQVRPVPYYPVDAGLSPGSSEIFLQSFEETVRVQRAAWEPRLGSEMVSWDWRVRTGSKVIELLDEAQLVDLIVIGVGDEVPGMSVAGRLIVQSPVPLLAVPREASQFDPNGPMMVAWNGASEAANAIRHALPLLKSAASTHIVSIDDESRGLPSADVATYLSRHGIHADVQEWPAKPTVEETLMAAAHELGASCIVMGGYGHSRARELVFGGVTRAMLKDCPVPLLLSH